MTTAQAERNIRLYYIFQMFKEPLFWGAILVIFITSVSSMSLADLYFMEAICVLGLVVLDGPFGALADLIGRRQTMLIGSGIFALKLLVFASAVNPLMIWIANFMWVLSYSLINGADSSMLADTLKFLGRDAEFQKIEGRSNAYRCALIAVCSFLIGYLAEINLRLPMYLGTPFMLIACLAVYFMVEPPIIAKQTRSLSRYWQLLWTSAKFIYRRNDIIWIIAFATLIIVCSKLWFFTYNPYFKLVELPLRYYGWIFCALNVVSAIFSHESERLSKWLGDFGSIVMMVMLIALPIWLMGFYTGQMMILMILLSNVVRGHMTPFIGVILHQHLDSANRATVVSLKSTVSNLGEFFALLFSWYALENYPLTGYLQGLGICTLIIGLILIATFRRSLRN